MPEEVSDNINKFQPTLLDTWAIRPCHLYKEEYNDCKSFKARFHQYFIDGETADCSQWGKDHEMCIRYEDSNGNDVKAAENLIKSEEERRAKRMEAHFNNTTWKKRENPPDNWSSPLPEWLQKRNENTYLQIKSNEMAGLIPATEEPKTYCVIM